MSVIVKDSEGKYILYSKGAESTIIPRCNPDKLTFSRPIIKFSKSVYSRNNEGYNTLCNVRIQNTATGKEGTE